jgi:hypothetical protein
MTTDVFSTLGTAPFVRLSLQKGLHSLPLDNPEVLQHTNVILSSVALIEGLESFTGKDVAFGAKPHQTLTHTFTVVLHVRTVLTAGQAARAVCFVKALLVNVVLTSEVTNAQRTVHPARGDKVFFHVGLLSLNDEV